MVQLALLCGLPDVGAGGPRIPWYIYISMQVSLSFNFFSGLGLSSATDDAPPTTISSVLNDGAPLPHEGSLLTLLEPQSRFGDKRVKFQVVCPQHGTAVLKGLSIESQRASK